MTHLRVNSSNVHSLAHEGETLEARFNCGKCAGTGRAPTPDAPACRFCAGRGHTGTYVYRGVPADVFNRVVNAPSVGKTFNKLVRAKFPGVKA